MSDEKKKDKYSFDCLEKECGNRACCTRDKVTVTIEDISRWTTQQLLSHIMHAVMIHAPESETDFFGIETKRQELKANPDKTACILFNEENNTCTIRYSRPISCRTFPLEYTGEKYILSNKDCAGIGRGEPSKEFLKEARDLAEQEYRERMSTVSSLPGIYSLFTLQMIEQSAKAMESLSEEDRQSVQEIMSRGDSSKDESAAPVDDDD
ncbi:MAG: YkgJ family cysteine cluster protein [Candidatus Thorarchaeota archaeon]|jgi:Fe-S-cluster containining protein